MKKSISKSLAVFLIPITVLSMTSEIAFSQVVPPPTGAPAFVDVPIYRSGWDLQRDQDRLANSIFGSKGGKPYRRGDLFRWHKIGVRKMRYSEYVKMREREAWLAHKLELRRRRVLAEAEANSFRSKSGRWALGTIKKIGSTRFYPTGEEVAGAAVQTADDTIDLFKGLTRVAGGSSWNDPYYGKHVRLDSNGNIIEIRPLTPQEAFESGIATGNPYVLLHGLADASPTKNWIRALYERQKSRGYTGSFEDFKTRCLVTGVICGAVLGGLKMVSGAGGAAGGGSGGGGGFFKGAKEKLKKAFGGLFGKKRTPKAPEPPKIGPLPDMGDFPDAGEWNKAISGRDDINKAIEASAFTPTEVEGQWVKVLIGVNDDGRIAGLSGAGRGAHPPITFDPDIFSPLDADDFFVLHLPVRGSTYSVRDFLIMNKPKPGTEDILGAGFDGLFGRGVTEKKIDALKEYLKSTGREDIARQVENAKRKYLRDFETTDGFKPNDLDDLFGGPNGGPKGPLDDDDPYGLFRGFGPVIGGGACGTASTPGKGGNCNSNSGGSAKPRVK